MSLAVPLSKPTVTGFARLVCVWINEEKTRSNSSGHHFLLILFIPFRPISHFPLPNLPFITLLYHNSAQCCVRTVDGVDLFTSCDQCCHLWMFFRCVITCILSKVRIVYRHVICCFSVSQYCAFKWGSKFDFLFQLIII